MHEGTNVSARRTLEGTARAWTTVIVLVAWLAPLPWSPAWAQGGPGSGPAAPESGARAKAPVAEETRSRLEEIESETARLEALVEEWVARTAELAHARESAPAVLAAIEPEVAKLEQREAPSIDPDRPLGELEADLLGHEQDLGLARKEASALEAEAAGRGERRKLIPQLLAAAKERLLALEGETVPPAGEPALVEARQRLLHLRREALQREIESYEEELRSYEARGQLLTMRREQWALRIAALDRELAALRDAIAARRRGEAESTAEEARRSLESAEAMPAAVLDVVRSLATENQELALRRTGEDGLLQNVDDVSRKLARAEEQVAEVTANLESLQRSVKVGGLSGSVGLLLRKTRSQAPDVGMYRRFIRMRNDRIAEVQAQQIELAERRETLKDIDDILAQKMAELETVLPPAERAPVEALLRTLLETQSRYLDILIADTDTYFQKLVDFDARQRELVSRTESLLRFIDERVLWIPSGDAFPPTFAGDARDAVAWLLSPRFWGQVVRALGTSIARAPLAFACAALLLLAAPFARGRVRAQIGKLGEQASQPTCIRIEPTAASLALSLLLAVWGPGLLAFLGWRLGASVDATQFVRCVAHGLQTAAFVWASLLIARELLRPACIAEAHLGWPAAATGDLRRRIRWLSAIAVPAVFLIGVFDTRGEAAWTESVGRLLFLVTMGAVLCFSHRVLREEGGSLPRIVADRPELAVPPRLWPFLHKVALVVPLALAAAALRGYTWTAVQLAASLHVTLVFLYLLLFAHQLGLRWALLATRRLALRRWEAATLALQESRNAAPGVDTPEPEEPEVDLATVDEQTGRLLRNGALLAALVGVWVIWADFLPVAGALRSVELWQTTSTETVALTNAAGEPVSSVEERIVPITLADLLLALVVGAAALALARNLPGLLEVSVFRQLPTSAGERYAYATIGKYGLTVAGAALALSAVGVGWSNIQWLLAAVGLGLGFGLQEIFANFVSGLIILFERPIRVGDTVTVGDISGTVSKIRIRATWITGFDRKELVVPNKEFVTGRLVNWSLSDAILRVEIPVGIAYGSDTEKASRVLREVAEKNQQILKEPQPYVLFRGFGESSLSFELRVFSPDVSHYLGIVHDLHMQIDRAFRAEGIEIAFPQRDLHLRSVAVAASDGESARSR